jgi:1,4-dihydroxy-2-naphthoate octaprenyltransferase
MIDEKTKPESRAVVWLKELRASFFTATLIPVIAGGLTSLAYAGTFVPLKFIITFIGAIFLHAGTNVMNDYFDYKSGNDIVNTEKNQPFSGGSPYLPAGILKPSNVFATAIAFFALGSLVGFYLALDMGLSKGWVIIVLGVIGVCAGYFYVEPRVNLCGRGIGEVFVGLCFGPLLVLGTFYVQTGTLNAMPVIVGIPIGFLIAAVLYINQFPDYNADRSVGKRNLVVRFGKEKAVNGYYLLVAGVYASIVVAVIAGFFIPSAYSLTPLALLSLATLPLAVRSATILKRHYNDSSQVLPAQAITIQVHLITGILLCAAIYLSTYFRLT